MPPVVDEDWHAICQAIHKGVEGSEWETMYCNYKEMHQAVKCKKSRENKKAMALWSVTEAKDKGTDVYDLGSVLKIKTRSRVRLDPLGNPLEESDGCSGRRAETYRAKKTRPVMSNERIVKSEAFGSYCSVACASCVNRARWE